MAAKTKKKTKKVEDVEEFDFEDSDETMDFEDDFDEEDVDLELDDDEEEEEEEDDEEEEEEDEEDDEEEEEDDEEDEEEEDEEVEEDDDEEDDDDEEEEDEEDEEEEEEEDLAPSDLISEIPGVTKKAAKAISENLKVAQVKDIAKVTMGQVKGCEGVSAKIAKIILEAAKEVGVKVGSKAKKKGKASKKKSSKTTKTETAEAANGVENFWGGKGRSNTRFHPRIVNEIPLRKLKLQKKLLRTVDEDKVESLKRSILKHGIIVPLIINEKNFIIDGAHRFTALEEIDKWETVPCFVLPDGAQIDDDLLGIIANVNRNEVDAITTARAIHKLVKNETYKNHKHAAQMLGMTGKQWTRSKVSKFLNLLEIDEEIQELVASGKTGWSVAIECQNVDLDNLDGMDRDKFLDKLSKGKMPVTKIRRFRKIQEGTVDPKESTEMRVNVDPDGTLLPDGVRVTIDSQAVYVTTRIDYSKKSFKGFNFVKEATAVLKTVKKPSKLETAMTETRTVGKRSGAKKAAPKSKAKSSKKKSSKKGKKKSKK